MAGDRKRKNPNVIMSQEFVDARVRGVGDLTQADEEVELESPIPNASNIDKDPAEEDMQTKETT